MNDIEKSEFIQYSSTFFHTYPKTEDLSSKEQLVELLKSKLSSRAAKIKHFVVGFELGHGDDDDDDKDHKCPEIQRYEHFHLVIKFDRKVNVRSADFWDLNGVHGYYTTLKKGGQKHYDFQRVRQYCKKDGDFIEEIQEVGITRMTNERAMTVYLASNMSKKKYDSLRNFKQEFRKLVHGLDIEYKVIYYLSSRRIDEAVLNVCRDKILLRKTLTSHKKSTFNIPSEIQYWMKDEIETKSLIMYGVSNTGKTSLARAIFKNPLIVSTKDGLNDLTEEHDGIIFDDFSLNVCSYGDKISLLDLDQNRDISVKHSYVWIPAGTPRIFTTNLDLKEFLKVSKDKDIPSQFSKRYVACHVKTSLVKKVIKKTCKKS